MDEPDTVARFNDRAEDYVRYRPTYPPAAIDAILEGLGELGRLVAADVGAGTAISARQLGDLGVHVVAVEPGAVMRAAADAHPNVRWVSGRAEATGLGTASVDVVLCAQSFHWFQTLGAVGEFGRILKPRGRLAIVWNRRSATDPFTAGFRQAIVDAGGATAAERLGFDTGVVDRSGLFSPRRRLVFPHSQHLDLQGLIGRAKSSSHVPKSGEQGARLVENLRVLHRQYADAHGFVTLVYDTEVFLAEKL
jgi:SAM-dependent methyltransferase